MGKQQWGAAVFERRARVGSLGPGWRPQRPGQAVLWSPLVAVLCALACSSTDPAPTASLGVDATRGESEALDRIATAPSPSPAAEGAPQTNPGATGAGLSVSPSNRSLDPGCVAGGTACSNCLDDDGDGLSDAFDPECTGLLDDDEGSFATGIPGDNVDHCQDCFFDGNSGHGDDGCQYATECLYGQAPPRGGSSACFQCEVSDACRDSCLDRTPNGCDCFGCCQLPDAAGQLRNVLLQQGCSLDQVGDELACPPCVPASDCFKDCGPCEVCIGRAAPLDPACDDGPRLRCPPAQAECDAQQPCNADEYCLTGCCVPRAVLR